MCLITSIRYRILFNIIEINFCKRDIALLTSFLEETGLNFANSNAIYLSFISKSGKALINRLPKRTNKKALFFPRNKRLGGFAPVERLNVDIHIRLMRIDFFFSSDVIQELCARR